MESFEIILPCFNEEDNIIPIFDEITKVVKDLDYKFLITFIDDGSDDETWLRIKTLNDKSKNVKGIKFSRNFGHQAAINAGLKNSQNQNIIVMDSDFQDDPKYITNLVNEWENGGKIVLAKRINRDENFLRKKIFSLFFFLQKKISDINIPKNVGHFSLLDKSVVSEINSFEENFRYFNGIRSYVGFETKFIEVVKNKRRHGESNMSYWKLFKLGINGIFGFSSKPLNLIAFLGIAISLGSLIFSAISLYYKYRYGTTLLGWTFGLSSIYFLSGIQLLSLSIIGQYVGNIFSEVKKRPNYIIKETTD